MTCLLRAWQAHQAELRAWLRRRAQDPDSADDLLQEVFLKAAARQRQFCELDNPRAWLFAVARNALIDRHRSERPQPALSEDLPDRLVPPPDTERAPLEMLADCLPRVLAQLSPLDRRALILCDLEGAPQQALAQELGLSLPGAKSRLQRARARLRAQMIQDCRVRFDERGQVCCLAPRASTPDSRLP